MYTIRSLARLHHLYSIRMLSKNDFFNLVTKVMRPYYIIINLTFIIGFAYHHTKHLIFETSSKKLTR